MQACGVVFPFAMRTSICRSIVTICSGLYLLSGMTRFSSKWILSHSTWYKFRRSGHARAPFWQTRYHDFNVWTEKKQVEKLRYMHRNPVKRGLVATPEDWRWSSYRFYLLDESGPVRMNEGWGKISFRAHAA